MWTIAPSSRRSGAMASLLIRGLLTNPPQSHAPARGLRPRTVPNPSRRRRLRPLLHQMLRLFWLRWRKCRKRSEFPRSGSTRGSMPDKRHPRTHHSGLRRQRRRDLGNIRSCHESRQMSTRPCRRPCSTDFACCSRDATSSSHLTSAAHFRLATPNPPRTGQ